MSVVRKILYPVFFAVLAGIFAFMSVVDIISLIRKYVDLANWLKTASESEVDVLRLVLDGFADLLLVTSYITLGIFALVALLKSLYKIKDEKEQHANLSKYIMLFGIFELLVVSYSLAVTIYYNPGAPIAGMYYQLVVLYVTMIVSAILSLALKNEITKYVLAIVASLMLTVTPIIAFAYLGSMLAWSGILYNLALLIAAGCGVFISVSTFIILGLNKKHEKAEEKTAEETKEEPKEAEEAE